MKDIFFWGFKTENQKKFALYALAPSIFLVLLSAVGALEMFKNAVAFAAVLDFFGLWPVSILIAFFIVAAVLLMPKVVYLAGVGYGASFLLAAPLWVSLLASWIGWLFLTAKKAVDEDAILNPEQAT